MSQALATRYVTPAYAQRFRCLGSACEDTCCQGWKIHLDREHFEATRAALAAGDGDGELASRALVLLPAAERTEARHAEIRLGADGFCPFLDADRMCGLQRRFGDAILGDVCATYPRTTRASGEQFEMSLALSCPEATRLCLLEPHATDLITIDLTEMTALDIAAGPDASASPYTRHHDEIRAVILRLLGDDSLPLAARLYAVSFLASRLEPILGRSIPSVDPVSVARTLALFDDRATLGALARQLDFVPVTTPLALSMIQLVAIYALRSKASAGLRTLTETALASYRRADEGIAASGRAGWPEASEPERLQAIAASRRQRLDETGWGAHLDACLARLAQNYWFREPFTKRPSVLRHATILLVRMASVRFLLLGQPELEPHWHAGAASPSPRDPGDLAAFDAALVRVVSRFAREAEHHPALQEIFESFLEDERLYSLAFNALLIKA
jgi:lysine-N-methylase